MTLINPFFKPKYIADKNETALNVFYTNDMHGDIYRLSKFKTAHDTFTHENKNTPAMTLAAGDCLFGADKQRCNLVVKLFNKIGLDALALGNHEFASGSKNLSDNLKGAEFKSVSANLEIDDTNSLNDRLKDKKLVKSAVFMKGGKKFAVIGASPINSYIGLGDNGVKPLDIDNTIKEINKEAKNLEEQGINKIILCSHLGFGKDGDLKVAQETEGIDIIVGGHTHTEINGVNQNKTNLVNSKRNEPVLITQAGGMNKKVGFLNAVFDEKGVLKTDKLHNELIDVNNFANSKYVENLMNKELGNKEFLAKVLTPYKAESGFKERFSENPLQNHIMDSILAKGKKFGAEIVLGNSSSMRGGMQNELTNYDIKYAVLPFNKEFKMIEITEKEVVDLLNSTIDSIVKLKKDPQLLRCAGMTYSVNTSAKDGNYIDEINLVDENGVTRSIDTKNPSTEKIIKTAVTTYLFDQPHTKQIIGKYADNAVTIGNEQEMFMDYLRDKKEIDYNPNEVRIKLDKPFVSWYGK